MFAQVAHDANCRSSILFPESKIKLQKVLTNTESNPMENFIYFLAKNKAFIIFNIIDQYEVISRISHKC